MSFSSWKVRRFVASVAGALFLAALLAIAGCGGSSKGTAPADTSDASLDDAGKVAGHTGTKTTQKVYDRAVLEAADRFADVRIKARERSGNGSGNVR